MAALNVGPGRLSRRIRVAAFFVIAGPRSPRRMRCATPGPTRNERRAVFDSATPAHVIEPKYPGAFEQVVDLSSCWDEHALFESREAIMALAAKISRCHEPLLPLPRRGGKPALRHLPHRGSRAPRSARWSRRPGAIALSEFKGGPGGQGRESVRFLSCVTNKGPVLFDGTAKALCDRIYLVDDVYGAASRLFLSALRSQALEAGWDVITCYCPLSPFEKIEHLFIPALRLGFMTANDNHLPDIEPYKIVRSRRFTDAEQIRAHRKRITFNRKASAQMLEQAARLLAEAKALHDQLEGYYTGAMDFAAVDAVGERTLQKYEHIFQSYGL